MDFASKTRETHPASNSRSVAPASMTDHSDRGVQKGAQRRLSGPLQQNAQAIQRQLKSPSVSESADVMQLARWRLESANSWIGIDPENIGTPMASPSGNYAIGTVFNDSNNEYL